MSAVEQVERGACVEAASFRVYRQADGRYIAFASVEGTGQSEARKMESGSHADKGDALAEVLVLSGFAG